MLNISVDTISASIRSKNYRTLRYVELKNSDNKVRKLILKMISVALIFLFVPWTQNIQSTGSVTTLTPAQRPHGIHSVIGGKIERWFVKEGDLVKKGDTILQISEVKDSYFDPELLQRSQNQIEAKEKAIIAYNEKMEAQNKQLEILKTQRSLYLSQLDIKIKQNYLKYQNDSAKYVSAEVDFLTAEKQFNRIDSLYKSGLKSLTDLEVKKMNLQKKEANYISALNSWNQTKNDLINLRLEKSTVQMKYQENYAKIQSSIFSTTTAKLDGENSLTKLRVNLSNYKVRNNLYYITAPQDGYVTKTISAGIGETIKDGEKVLTLMPVNYDLAIEIYVEPLDLPLVNRGQAVRIQFDGWPAIVFSGWPNTSHGTYGGVVYAIDQYISENGKYRILVSPDPTDDPWPNALRFGGGTRAFMMLGDVPIWYELWRNLNGFPANFYQPTKTVNKSKKH